MFSNIFEVQIRIPSCRESAVRLKKEARRTFRTCKSCPHSALYCTWRGQIAIQWPQSQMGGLRKYAASKSNFLIYCQLSKVWLSSLVFLKKLFNSRYGLRMNSVGKKKNKSKATKSVGKAAKSSNKKNNAGSGYYFGDLTITSINSLGVFASSAV